MTALKYPSVTENVLLICLGSCQQWPLTGVYLRCCSRTRMKNEAKYIDIKEVMVKLLEFQRGYLPERFYYLSSQ
jgi:hypothetical protein